MLEDIQNGCLQKISKYDRLVDFSEVPWPDRSVVRDKRGMLKNFIQTSRGCPFACSFCSVIKFFGHSYRLRPVEDIVAEIKMLKRNRKTEMEFCILF